MSGVLSSCLRGPAETAASDSAGSALRRIPGTSPVQDEPLDLAQVNLPEGAVHVQVTLQPEQADGVIAPETAVLARPPQP